MSGKFLLVGLVEQIIARIYIYNSTRVPIKFDAQISRSQVFQNCPKIVRFWIAIRQKRVPKLAKFDLLRRILMET